MEKPPPPEPEAAGAAASGAPSLLPARELRLHAQAHLVPSMAAEDYRAFSADIAEYGIQVALEISAEKVVLDGRERLRAAHELEIELVPVRIVTPEDEVEHMLRAALNRRHLSASQRAA